MGVLTGGMALLARMRSQQKAAPVEAKPKRVYFVYGSQTGTAHEIARTFHAEATEKGIEGEVMSWDELGFASIGAEKTPILVVVQSSTGDGDPPDNSAMSYATIRKAHGEGHLKGVQFSMMAVGDSNYTRFMGAPRLFRKRLLELGAEEFYPSVEADEVDGLECKIDPYMEGLLPALIKARSGEAPASTPPTTAAAAATATDASTTSATAPAATPTDAAATAIDARATSATAAAATPTAAAAAAAATATGATATTAVADSPSITTPAKEGAGTAAAAPHASDAPAAAVSAAPATDVVTPAAAAASADIPAPTPASAAAPVNPAKTEAPPVAPPAASGGAAILARLRSAQAAPQAPPVPVAATGGAALLARMRQAKVAQAKAKGPPPVMIVYGSQTGTAHEIARNVHAEATQRGIAAEVMSWDELGFSSLGAEKTPILVVVQSSTGDGDPPDNCAMAYATIRKAHGESQLKGVQFSMMAIGDSNYTRFMGAPRLFRKRLLDLGAQEFYPCVEADEVDGIECKVDPYMENLWAPLLRARSGEAPASAAATATTTATATDATATTTAAAAATATTTSAAAATTTDAVATATDATATTSAAAAATTTDADASATDATATTSTATDATATATASNAIDENGLINGLAPDGVDLKGVPALLPCLVKVEVQTEDATVQAVREKEQAGLSPQQLEYRDPDGVYSVDKPYYATVTESRYESAPWSDRKLLHLRFDLGTSGMPYEAGDSLSVMPSNPAEMVSGLLARLALAPDSVVSIQAADGSGKPMHPHIPSPCTLGHVFTKCVDITSVTKKSVVRMLAEHCSNAEQKRTLLYLVSRAGRPAYQHEIMLHQPSTLDLLTRFDSCTPPLDALLDALPPMPARLYSITTSPAEHPTACDTCMSVVSFKTKYGDRKGVATTWLDSLTAPGSQTPPTVQVPVSLKRAADFKPPSDLSKPIIMVGPGTGVAPFRGFLQHHRQAIKRAFPAGLPAGQLSENVGPSWLFFGCRKEDEDFLYKSDFKAFVEDKTLSRLETAFSRAQAEKVYVQHLMKQNGEALVKLLDTGAYCYVCGDGANMAKDVHATLLEMLITHKGLSSEDAAAYMSTMVQEKRYIRDIWS